MLSERKETLLKLVVEHFIATVQPIASRFLIDEDALDIGEATVRNELRALEEAGYLTHPHTSAGRIPTELGYQYYVDHIMQVESLAPRVEQQIQNIIAEESDRKIRLKSLAKVFSEKSGNAVIISFDRQSMYYMGMSYLFAQPEFRDYANTVQVSRVFDHCEEKMGMMDSLLQESMVHTFIGQKNPLGAACASVGAKLSHGEIFLFLGPMRMDYKQSIPFVSYIQKHI